MKWFSLFLVMLIFIPVIAFAQTDMGMSDNAQLVGFVTVLVAGLVQKHVFKKLPNNVIPYTSMAIATGGYMLAGAGLKEALGMGVLTGASATGTHQAVKILVRGATQKIFGWKVSI